MSGPYSVLTINFISRVTFARFPNKKPNPKLEIIDEPLVLFKRPGTSINRTVMMMSFSILNVFAYWRTTVSEVKNCYLTRNIFLKKLLLESLQSFYMSAVCGPILRVPEIRCHTPFIHVELEADGYVSIWKKLLSVRIAFEWLRSLVVSLCQ